MGPLLLVWFICIAAAGIWRIPAAPVVLRAFDPTQGLRFLLSGSNTAGLTVLGMVFLAASGTELLYANLDFAGRRALTAAGPFVIISLFANYLGQGAWLISRIGAGEASADLGKAPFFMMLPAALRVPALLLAVCAAWAASQAVINGSFTLVSEAIRLDLLPRLKILWPSDSIRQEYIPQINWLLCLGCCLAAAGFRSSERMAGAYGLAIALAMLMTTILHYVCLRKVWRKPAAAVLILIVFGLLEIVFLIGSLGKLLTGGIVVMMLTLAIFFCMLAWDRARSIERRYTVPMAISDYIPQLEQLRSASAYPFYTDNLVYVEEGADIDSIDRSILWSILEQDLKRARRYWFITVHTVSEPYAERFTVKTFGTDFIFRVQMELGYKCTQPVTWYLKKVIRDLGEQGKLQPRQKKHALSDDAAYGVFKYCVLKRVPSSTMVFPLIDELAIRVRTDMQKIAGFREEWYSEPGTDVTVEKIPLDPDEERAVVRLVRVWPDKERKEEEEP